MSANSRGVLPLVCCVCEQTVGAINERALMRMLGAEEIYICTACSEHASEAIEQALARQEPGHYTHLVSQAIARTAQSEVYAETAKWV